MVSEFSFSCTSTCSQEHVSCSKQRHGSFYRFSLFPVMLRLKYIRQHYAEMNVNLTAPQHLVCRAVQSLHINHMQMGIIEVFICRRLHTKCCGAVPLSNNRCVAFVIQSTF